MTDEEKAKEYAHSKMAYCEDYNFDYKTAELYIKQGVLYGLAEGREEKCNSCGLRQQKRVNLEKENAELKAQIRLIESVSDANADENTELKKQEEILLDRILTLQKTNGSLTDKINVLEEQIEKMKICSNCKHLGIFYDEELGTIHSCVYQVECHDCDKWESALNAQIEKMKNFYNCNHSSRALCPNEHKCKGCKDWELEE